MNKNYDSVMKDQFQWLSLIQFSKKRAQSSGL